MLYGKFNDFNIERSGFRYPNPFFDITNHFIPTDLKTLFRWFEYVIFTNPIIAGAIHNLVSYPLTEPIIEGGDKDKIKQYLEDINWRSFFIDVGLNRYVYGNAFVVFFPPIDREFICPKCKNKFSDKQVEFKFRKDKFESTCPKCNYKGVVDYREFHDQTDISRAVFKIWNPKLVGLKVHPITNKKEYYSDLPNKIKNSIITNDPFFLRDTPVSILKAAHGNKQIKFNPKYVYHMKTKSLAGYNQDWGISPLMPLMKHLFHIQILRKANEAIALEHIVPMRIIFPQISSLQEAQMINLAMWRDSFKEAVKNWRWDKNHIFISNVPVGTQYIGGQYKMLEVNAYIENLIQEISAGLGIPKEFIFGGLTWSGSSVSLRMLENQLATYIGELRDLLRWMVNIICDHFGLRKPHTVKFVPFKMVDDVQQKQLLLELAVNNKISTRTLIQSLGLDYDKEVEALKNEIKLQAEIQYIQQDAMADVQAKLQQDMMERAQMMGMYSEDLQGQDQQKQQEQEEVPKINKDLEKPYPEQKPSARTQIGV